MYKQGFKHQELEYLRGELNQNIKFSNEHTHRLFGHIILVWGGTLVLFSAEQKDIINKITMLFMMATIFFMSVMVLYFLALRLLEGSLSIYKIAAYIAVFYEQKPKSEEDKNIFWESTNFEIEKNSSKKQQWECNNKFVEKLEKELDKYLNHEYFWLSIIAIVVIIAIFIQSLIIDISFVKKVFMGIVCFCYISVSAYLSYKIRSISFFTPKNWINIKEYYREYYVRYATEMGYYTPNEAKKEN